MTQGHDYAVRESQTIYSGARFGLSKDRVAMPGGGTADRIYLRHPGAVAVAGFDEHGRVLLIHQYRHPVRRFLWELPAGLRDVDGEDPALTAARELTEETDMVAGRLEHLLDVFPSPGCSDERISIYTAYDLRPVEGVTHRRTEEEAELTSRWWKMDEALAAVASGEITNNICVTALLAVAQSR